MGSPRTVSPASTWTHIGQGAGPNVGLVFGGWGYIKLLWVDAALRGRGHGTRLLQVWKRKRSALGAGTPTSTRIASRRGRSTGRTATRYSPRSTTSRRGTRSTSYASGWGRRSDELPQACCFVEAERGRCAVVEESPRDGGRPLVLCTRRSLIDRVCPVGCELAARRPTIARALAPHRGWTGARWRRRSSELESSRAAGTAAA